MHFYEQHNSGNITNERIEIAAKKYAEDPRAMFELLQENYAVSGVIDPVTVLRAACELDPACRRLTNRCSSIRFHLRYRESDGREHRRRW